jgi:hypothetical protein
MIFFLIQFFFLFSFAYSRSPLRTSDEHGPQITARWKGETGGVTVYDRNFTQYPLFAYGTADILNDLLPEKIPYADQSGHITRVEIERLIEEAWQEISTRKRKVKKAKQLKAFTILQYKNFSFRRGCGLLVLKFKNHPFVLKLFVEKPETFINPYIKGMEPIFFHFMAGGVNRHVSGLTRVKNLNLIKEIVSNDPTWGPHICFPRKWYWIPKNNKEIELIGKNIAEHDITLHIPSMYAIIADYIDTEHQLDLPLAERKKMVMDFSNDIAVYLDPHFNNYVFHPAIIDGKESYKITIIDTEHFPTIVGLENECNFKTHFDWYMHLVGKCTYDMYFKTKKDLIERRTFKSPLGLDDPIFYQKRS